MIRPGGFVVLSTEPRIQARVAEAAVGAGLDYVVVDHAGQLATVITYGYTWTTARWEEEEFDDLSWQWHHDATMCGELSPTLDTTI
ncbi:MAG: hypothetical protein ABIY55_08150 [Kofleriaceae bacterium]